VDGPDTDNQLDPAVYLQFLSEVSFA
jgi:hypothetical protein